MPTAERIEATASRMISQQARSNEDLVRRFVDNCRRTRRRTPDRSPHRRAGVFTELAAQNARLVLPPST